MYFFFFFFFFFFYRKTTKPRKLTYHFGSTLLSVSCFEITRELKNDQRKTYYTHKKQKNKKIKEIKWNWITWKKIWIDQRYEERKKSCREIEEEEEEEERWERERGKSVWFGEREVSWKSYKRWENYRERFYRWNVNEKQLSWPDWFLDKMQN